MNRIKLDLTDRKILAELDKDCRIPASLLAKKVNKSREAVKYRIQQLQKKGVLERFITSINPNKLGYSMFKVYLKLENIPDEREKFFDELKKNKDIYWFGISDGAATVLKRNRTRDRNCRSRRRTGRLSVAVAFGRGETTHGIFWRRVLDAGRFGQRNFSRAGAGTTEHHATP